MYQNLKIAINDQQPLGEVVKELERLGYEIFDMNDPVIYTTVEGGAISFPLDWKAQDVFKITTLAELKEMQ